MIWLGPVGNLQQLPSIARGIDASIELRVAVHQVLSGGRVADRIGQPRRTYTLPGRRWLSVDDLGILEGLALGMYGPEPYALIDPWRRNLLTANQCSGTDVLRDATGFAGSAGSTLSSSTLVMRRGARSLQWVFTAAPAGDRWVHAGTGDDPAVADPADPLDAIPVLPSTDYSFTCWARKTASVDNALELTAFIAWYDQDGDFLDATDATGQMPEDEPVQLVVTGASPPGAALARVSVSTFTTTTVTNTVHVDELQLEQSAQPRRWVPGTGVPRVAITGLSEEYPVLPFVDTAITLVEVG